MLLKDNLKNDQEIFTIGNMVNMLTPLLCKLLYNVKRNYSNEEMNQEIKLDIEVSILWTER